MSERIRGSYDDVLYKSTYTYFYFTYKSRSSKLVPIARAIMTVEEFDSWCRTSFVANRWYMAYCGPTNP